MIVIKKSGSFLPDFFICKYVSLIIQFIDYKSYNFLIERILKTKVDNPVKSATSPVIITSLIQGSPVFILSLVNK